MKNELTRLFCVFLACCGLLPASAVPVDSLKPPVEFGMRLRPAPSATRLVYEPVVAASAPSNEATLVKRMSGELCVFFINRPGDANQLMFIRSVDGGISWSEPIKAFDLPGQAYYANQVLEDREGVLHAVFHVFSAGGNGYRGRHLDLWYARKRAGEGWEKPKKIYTGYVGSMRGFIQLTNGRLLLPFARAVPSREQKPASGEVDYGWNEIATLYSDDSGENWVMADDLLTIEVDPHNVTRYGAIEPTLIEQKNGDVWMLIRTNTGRLYESFSKDRGTTWSQPQPTNWISSDSPATLTRLRDNRLIVMWCGNQRHDNPRSYANGGREVLHAAISSDEGRTWHGYREILISLPESGQKGDRGAAYPSAVENSDGKVVFVSGQAEARAIALFDPNWLEEKRASDDLSDGLEQWTCFGAGNDFDRSTGEAVWNFPAAEKGKIRVHIRGSAPVVGLELGLTDHFSISQDTMAMANAVVGIGSQELGIVKTGGEQVVEMTWDNATEEVVIRVNGAYKMTKRFSRSPINGLNYFRIGPLPVNGKFLVTAIEFKAL